MQQTALWLVRFQRFIADSDSDFILPLRDPTNFITHWHLLHSVDQISSRLWKKKNTNFCHLIFLTDWSSRIIVLSIQYMKIDYFDSSIIIIFFRVVKSQVTIFFLPYLQPMSAHVLEICDNSEFFSRVWSRVEERVSYYEIDFIALRYKLEGLCDLGLMMCISHCSSCIKLCNKVNLLFVSFVQALCDLKDYRRDRTLFNGEI